jgi:hypothetical protein
MNARILFRPPPRRKPLRAPIGEKSTAAQIPALPAAVLSTKEILLRCCGLVTCDEARVALEGYPPTFDAWKAAVQRPVTEEMAHV